MSIQMADEKKGNSDTGMSIFVVEMVTYII